MKNVQNIIGFNWDEANIDKNYLKHNILWVECEEVFFNKPVIIVEDEKHSDIENRYYTLGKTNDNKKLFLVFTIRKNKIRIISARTMHKKEKRVYENFKKKENSKFSD